MPGDWWTGSSDAGLQRALAMGAPPPPGSLPPEMMNAYRMARAPDPLSFDAPRGPSRGELVQGWQAQAAAAAPQAEAPARRRRRTAQDAGNAIAQSIA